MKGQPLQERFWSKVEKTETCWNWIAGRNSDGYGRFSWGKLPSGRQASIGAHRWAYEQAYGPIPDGLHIDHLCRNPACVNPAHLEAVSPRINTLRGISITALNAGKTHCIHGHEFTEANTLRVPKGRQCRTCRNAIRRVNVARRIARMSGDEKREFLARQRERSRRYEARLRDKSQ